MAAFLGRYWFLLGLIFALVAGGVFGHLASPQRVSGVLGGISPSGTTAAILFLMAFSLDSTQRWEALKRPWAAAWGCIVNIGLVPLIAWPIAQWQSLPDFRWGLLVTAATPCTLATASVFTRRAGGNDAVSLLTTLITNLGCVFILPFWMSWYFSRTGGVNLTSMIESLAYYVVIPTIIGQVAQLPPVLQTFSRVYRGRISTLAQMLVLLLVGVAAVNAGFVLQKEPAWPAPLAIGLIIAGCVTVHLIALVLGWYGGRILRLPRPDLIAVAFAGSQKTLPVGLMIVTTPGLLTQAAPFITFPLVIYHAGQLLIDALLAERWKNGPAAE